MSGVTLITCFEVPEGREDDFLTIWQEVNAFVRSKPGYLEHKLFRSLSPFAAFRFINVMRWTSVEEFNAAHNNDEFRALIMKRGWESFLARPALYEVAHQGHAEVGSAASR